MKTLIKFMSLTIIGFIVCFCLIYLININIMINEMNNASRVAVESCQNIIKSKILDDYVGFNDTNYVIYDDKSYKDYFISTFNNLVTKDELYDIEVNCDYDTGLLAVHIHNKYSSFIRDKKLINIVEVYE